MVQDQQTYRRAAGAALIGLALQVVLALGMTLLAMWAKSAGMDPPDKAISAAALHLLFGVPIWIILWMVYHQHELERVEALEVEQITRGGGDAAALFESREAELRTARRRLQLLYKWSVPALSLVVAAFLIGVGLLLFLRNAAVIDLRRAGVGTGSDHLVILSASLGVAFCGFIVARYLSGMTSVKEWVLLRGGASYLMGSAVVSGVLVALGALAAYLGVPAMYELLTAIIPSVMVVIGVETVLHFLLGLYRPRRPGEVPRPAFDSRLLGWLTSPESIARIISETINYQFGIEVSKSWFYRLLSKAVTPLLAFSLAILVLISAIVIVEPQDMAIITRFGVPVGDPVGPGLHFKWPWPIGAADKQPVGRVLTLELGSKQAGFVVDPNKIVLWTNTHAGTEVYMLTAPTRGLEAAGAPTTQGAVPSAAVPGAVQPSSATTQPSRFAGWLIGAQIYVQYRVDDMAAYVRCAKDPAKLLHDLAEAEVNRYFVSKDIDELLLESRLEAGERLKQVIQGAFDNQQVHTGVVVLAVDLSGLHPPSEGQVAEAFLKQIAAGQKAKSAIDQARRKAVQALAGVAGTPEQADKLYKMALEDLGKSTAERQELLTIAQGEAGKIISAARALRWQKSLSERGAASMFQAQLLQNQAAPEYFLAAQYADLIASLPADARKYVVDVDPSVKPIWEVDLKDEVNPLESLLPPTR